MRDPPGVVDVEPSVVIDLLYPRSAGSSSLALHCCIAKWAKHLDLRIFLVLE